MKAKGKVTRTKVEGVMRTKTESGDVVVTIIGEPRKEIVGMLLANNPGAEIGYMPLTYEMEEEEFIDSAELTTNVETSPMFPTKESCPKSAQELKKMLGTDNKTE